MKTVGKIIACLTAACLLLGMMTVIRMSLDLLSEDTVAVDSASAVYDEQALYEELFAPDSVVRIDVNMPRSEMAKMQQDFRYYRAQKVRSPIYRKADSVTITVNGKKYMIEEVGLRLKGSTTRSNFYNDVMGLYNLVNLNISFTEPFDDWGAYSADAKQWESSAAREKRLHRTFATMKKMEFKWNNTADCTYSRTVYCHEMFRAFGVPVQRCEPADIRIGGTRMGVGRIYEPIDEDFIRRYLPREAWGGDLYKVRRLGVSPASYTLRNTYGKNLPGEHLHCNFDIKTNEDSTEHAAIQRLLTVVDSPGATGEEVEAVVDTDELAMVLAVGFLSGNQDDIRFNYNNHYLYFREDNGKACFFPYDCEIVLGSTFSWDPSGSSLTAVSPFSTYNYSFQSEQENPLLMMFLEPDGFFRDKYEQALRRVYDSGWLTEEHYLPYYESARRRYGDRVISGWHFMNTLGRNTDFTMEGGSAGNGNMAVGEFFDKMRANAAPYLAGIPPVSASDC